MELQTQESFWVLSWSEGEHKGKFLYITDVHLNIVPVIDVMKSYKFPSEDRAKAYGEKHSFLYGKLKPKLIQVTYNITIPDDKE